jgi:hypothetical protein
MLPPVAPEPQVLAVGTATASVTFTHPSAPAGVTYALVVTDDADNEVTPDSGSGLGPWVFPVADGRAYKATLTATAASGQTSIAAVIVVVETADLTAPTPPAPQSLASTATTASVTWTHAGAPGGTTYALTVVDSEDGEIAPDSGTGLGAWVFPVVSGRAYIPTITATGPDGQTAKSSALVAVAAEASPPGGAWTLIGDIDFVGATAQTFSTTGDKTVTLSGGGTVTVNATMSVGNITTGTAGVDAARGLIADVPGAVGSTAYRLRTAVPVSPSVGATDDLLVSIRWKHDAATGNQQRALVGITTSSGTEASSEFSGDVRQNAATNVVGLQSRKSTSVATVAASVPSGWRDGTTTTQSDIRVVGKARTLLVTAGSRDVDSGSATYVADIGGDSSGPNVGLEAPLFSGGTVYVQFYVWNGGASGPANSAAIERIQVYRRDSVRVP